LQKHILIEYLTKGNNVLGNAKQNKNSKLRKILIPYHQKITLEENEMLKFSYDFLAKMKQRRTVRDYSSNNVPIEIIENAIASAATAPSGANQQPWHFVVVKNNHTKKEIRVAAEKEEVDFYNHKASQEWLDALHHIGTDEQKPHLEDAPYLIIVFAERYSLDKNKNKIKNYYVSESVGIATGILLTSLHLSGLVTLTHTPSPMKFLNKILNRPSNESAYLIIATGYPSKNAKVPKITKKSSNEFSSKYL
tara:strand:- start:1459 stop:2208 length:750 start_codon:yes stop_codon:yes gene_type:complete